MTLFEAIRQFHEGQRIEWEFESARCSIDWNYKQSRPEIWPIQHDEWSSPATIIDLPKPQVLYDVLVGWIKDKGTSLRCSDCKYNNSKRYCDAGNCSIALIDTLYDIAFAAGINLKEITAEESAQ